MALSPRRASVVLLVALALAAIVFSSADAARDPKALEQAGQEEAAAADGRQAQAYTAGSDDDAVPFERVVAVVDKRGGGGGHGGGGHGGGGEGGGRVGGGGGGEGEGEGEGSSGLGGAGYHGHGTGRGGPNSSASSGRDGVVWKLGVSASVLGAAAAWLL